MRFMLLKAAAVRDRVGLQSGIRAVSARLFDSLPSDNNKAKRGEPAQISTDCWGQKAFSQAITLKTPMAGSMSTMGMLQQLMNLRSARVHCPAMNHQSASRLQFLKGQEICQIAFGMYDLQINWGDGGLSCTGRVTYAPNAGGKSSGPRGTHSMQWQCCDYIPLTPRFLGESRKGMWQ